MPQKNKMKSDRHLMLTYGLHMHVHMRMLVYTCTHTTHREKEAADQVPWEPVVFSHDLRGHMGMCVLRRGQAAHISSPMSLVCRSFPFPWLS